MRSRNVIAGAAVGLALGVGTLAALDAGTGAADAQSGFKVSPAQLRINQKISSAAVLRSNRSLNYLAPIRTSQTDGADTGSNGVRPLTQVPGAGDGWTSSQIGDGAVGAAEIAAGAVTEPKIGAGAVTESKIGGGSVSEPKLADGVLPYYAAAAPGAGTTLTVVRGRGATTAGSERIAVGNYRVKFGRDLTSCTLFPSIADADYTALPSIPAGYDAKAAVDAVDQTRAVVVTYDQFGALIDSDFTIQVIC
jgi:hypothetical protein